MILNEWEEVGIKILVLIHTGAMNITQGEVDLRAKVPRDLQDEFDYQLTDPMKYIPQNIVDFIDEYFYYEKYNSAAPSYEDVNPRYWEAVKLYDSYKNRITNVSNKPTADKPKGVSAKDALELYNKKR
jgi:hypothetical protein